MRVTPNDPGFAQQWHLPNIWAPAGWEISAGSPAVTIAVVDSGVYPHPDLTANLVPGYNFLANNTDTHDVLNHGTAVAGAAAAAGNNGVGGSGVTWRSKIMPLVVLNSSNVATPANVAKAIIYAADHGARVINLSMSYNTSYAVLLDAVNYAWGKGCIIVAAAGNHSSSAPFYPAAYQNVLSVGATDKNNARLSWSDYGDWLDVVAPGIDIYTTKNGGGYWLCWGTSLACPLVAGLAALILSVKPTATNAEVISLIKNNTSDFGAPGFDPLYGWGRINVLKSLQAASANQPLTAEGDTTMADQVRPPYTPPPDDPRIPTPSLKEQFTAALTLYVNSSPALTALSQQSRDKLIADVVAIAYPTTTSTQTR